MDEMILTATAGTLRTLVDGTVRIQIDFEPRHMSEAIKWFGKPGTSVYIARMSKEAEQQMLKEETASKEFAEELYQSSFFRTPKVWKAIGTDDELKKWIIKQPCAYCKNTENIHPAHVRRIRDGFGTALKGEYAMIPLCYDHHINYQHQHGESALGGKEQFDKWRIEYLHKWCWETLKKKLGYQSWLDVPREKFKAWCEEHELIWRD